MEIKNVNQLSEQFIWQDKVGLMTKSLGEACGSRKIYVNIDYVPPGAYSTRYHSHSQQEEFFLILSGTGTLKLNGEEKEVSTGDFIGKPAGENIAHTFYNSGNEVLEILDVGTNEQEDTCYYPEEDMYMHKSNGVRRCFSGKDISATWYPEPNPLK
ncbi:mannose-6-phosphate isomerase [Lacrimispora xylanolytica]